MRSTNPQVELDQPAVRHRFGQIGAHWRSPRTMDRGWLPLVLLLMLGVSGCGALAERPGSRAEDRLISTAIEKLVVAAHPEIEMKHYDRFYWRDLGGNVIGTYVLANDGLVQSPEEWGKSYWVSPHDRPIIMDGGCTVVNVRYDLANERLVSVSCNGEA
jgi:hypothetical protein